MAEVSKGECDGVVLLRLVRLFVRFAVEATHPKERIVKVDVRHDIARTDLEEVSKRAVSRTHDVDRERCATSGFVLFALLPF